MYRSNFARRRDDVWLRGTRREREFAAKFDGREYESEFEWVCYLLGTDVFIEVASERLNESSSHAQISSKNALDACDEAFLSLREWDGAEHWRVCASDEILRVMSEDADGGAAYLLLSPRHIAAEEFARRLCWQVAVGVCEHYRKSRNQIRL